MKRLTAVLCFAFIDGLSR